MTFTQCLILLALLTAAYVAARAMLRAPAPIDPWVAATSRRQAEGPPDIRGLGFDLELRYIDSKDRVATRRVTVQDAWGSFSPQDGFHLQHLLRGWCHLRHGERVFHVMSMERVTDLATGESVSGPWRIERFLSARIGAELAAGRGQRQPEAS